MASLWRVLALAWMSGAGAPSLPAESLLPDTVIERRAESGAAGEIVTLTGSDAAVPQQRDRPGTR